MFIRLLFLMTFIPFVEIYFLLQMSGRIGFGNTVLIVLLTGVLGAWLLRKQGHSILRELQQQGSQGQAPTDTLAKGFFTFLGGVLLLTPGFLTDALGLSLIFPPTQLLWKHFFMGQWQQGVRSGNIHVYTAGRRPNHQEAQRSHADTGFSKATRPSFDHSVIDIQPQSSETRDKKEDH